MTSTLNTTSSHYLNPMMNQYRKRVLLKRSTQQINDPHVVQQIKLAAVSPPKKSVRFHDELEHIRYFYKTQASTSVKKDPPFMDTSADDYKLTMPNWPTRNSIFYNTEQKIRMENVQLVDGDIQDMSNNKLLIEGRCRALNISFHKVVTIRYTFDLWRTYQETTAEFRESIASTSNTWDRFSFHIPVEADKRNTQSLYLALKYTVDDVEYWDNNSGANYELKVTPDIQEQEQETQEEEQQQQEQQEELALTEKKDTTKVLGRRYDFTASLTAARKPYSPPPSPPGTPVDNGNFTYTPPVFFSDSQHQLFDTTPVYQIVPSPTAPVKQPPQLLKASLPITPPDSPPLSAEGFQMSYSDFVNKYCFYNSTPIYGTSPSAVLS